MIMVTKSFNKKREIDDFVNSKKLPKDRIVTIFQEVDKTYTLVYYDED